MGRLDDAVVVITGAGSGIGAAGAVGVAVGRLEPLGV
jgi:NADP-dependent 3-hydroxy acid dehydrogenase YdfG